jgi:transketolase
VIGGLGSCVAEVLSENGAATKLTRFGCQDQFGESGEPVELYEKHGFSAAKIADRIG